MHKFRFVVRKPALSLTKLSTSTSKSNIKIDLKRCFATEPTKPTPGGENTKQSSSTPSSKPVNETTKAQEKKVYLGFLQFLFLIFSLHI